MRKDDLHLTLSEEGCPQVVDTFGVRAVILSNSSFSRQKQLAQEVLEGLLEVEKKFKNHATPQPNNNS